MFEVGVTLGGRYLLVNLIARGGMGEVWSAQDVVLDRRVAVKVLLPNLATDPGFTARFRAEARAMAALSHPGIIEIYDYGQADGLAFLVMQFVEGESLVSLLRRTGPLPPERAMRLLVQAAEAIDAAHRQGIVHRDVKPANLLLRQDGRLALTDFGIARILATDRLTAADQIVGTSSYLAPEQVTGDEIGPATDVYALGVVAYELLAGGRPFAADTPFEVALMHVHEEPPSLPPGVPEPIRELVLRAMAKDPADRWPSAAALAQAASAAIGEARTTGTAGATTTGTAGAKRTGRAGATTTGRAGTAGTAATGRAGTAGAAGAATTGMTGARRTGPAGQGTAASDEPAGWEAMTGPTTRTARRGAVGPDKPVQTAAASARRRLFIAGGAAVTLATAAVLIVILSPGGAETPQSQGTETSSPAATVTASSASTVPAQSAGTGTGTGTGPGTGTGTPTAGTRTTAPGMPAQANPAPASPGVQQSTPATTATVPAMYGWKEAEVESEMTRLGLVARIERRSTQEQCYVIEQSPPGGTVVPRGSTVDVVIAIARGICKEV